MKLLQRFKRWLKDIVLIWRSPSWIEYAKDHRGRITDQGRENWRIANRRYFDKKNGE